MKTKKKMTFSTDDLLRKILKLLLKESAKNKECCSDLKNLFTINLFFLLRFKFILQIL